MKLPIVIIPEGYNGHTIKCFAIPIETDKRCIKLKTLSGYITWIHKEWYHKSIKRIN